MTPPTHGFRLLRNATLSLALQHAFVRPLFHWRTSRAHTYADSPLNASRNLAGAPPEAAVGAVMPNLGLDDGTYLLDHLRPQYHVIVSADTGEFAALRELRAALEAQGMALGILAIGESAAAALPEAGFLPDAGGKFGKAVANAEDGGPRVFLVRPDQHIAGVWRALDRECIDRIGGALRALDGTI